MNKKKASSQKISKAWNIILIKMKSVWSKLEGSAKIQGQNICKLKEIFMTLIKCPKHETKFVNIQNIFLAFIKSNISMLHIFVNFKWYFQN